MRERVFRGATWPYANDTHIHTHTALARCKCVRVGGARPEESSARQTTAPRASEGAREAQRYLYIYTCLSFSSATLISLDANGLFMRERGESSSLINLDLIARER